MMWLVTMARRLPDEHEAVEGAGVAVATAAGLLRDADLLAGAGSYGTAVSLEVLGFEESVKARSLGAVAAAEMGRRPGFSDDALWKIIYGGHRGAARRRLHPAGRRPASRPRCRRWWRPSSPPAAAGPSPCRRPF